MDELRSHKFTGSVEGTYVVAGSGVGSAPVPVLQLTYAGITGDRHAGLVRPSGPREPWYPRGTEMRNERQLSIVSAEELALVAATLGIERLPAEWIGANLLLAGVRHLSLLPPRTLLSFPSGAVIRVDGDNTPCRKSGKSIVGQLPDRPDIEFGFVKAALNRRGVVGWVEREGEVRPGDVVSVMTWRQSLYPAD